MKYEIWILVDSKWVSASKTSHLSGAKGLEAQYKLGGYKTKVTKVKNG